MNFNTDNEIDKQIIKTFTKESMETLKPINIEYFGINLSSSDKCDNIYKIYYENNPSKRVYAEKDKNPIIEYLYSLDMVRTLQVVNDNSHRDFSKFDIGIQNRTNENMEKVFSFFEQNIPLFKKYKKEILKLTEMKLYDDNNHKYASFHFIGFVHENNLENTLFKAYWSNYISPEEIVFDKDYYLEFLANLNIPQFKILSKIAKNILNYCGGRLYMEGIDYTNEGAVSHKIYIKSLNLEGDVYNGLKKSIPKNYQTLKNRIEKLNKWNKLHSELKLEGVAIGIDIYNNKNLKLYYKYQENILLDTELKKSPSRQKRIRYYPVKQFGLTRQQRTKNNDVI